MHETEAELFSVIDGSGTLVSGGTVVDDQAAQPGNGKGRTIRGGTQHILIKGDLFIVPENTPHQFLVGKGPLVLISMHLPRGAAPTH